jgi:hypothetical protein
VLKISELLQPEVQEFIASHLESNASEIALKKNPFPGIDYIQVMNQIIAKQKAKEKLPTWFATQNIIYPSKISVEQTSSEKTAAYKASLVSGDSLIDLTGGFGVDDYYFSKNIKVITHCEINEDLSNIVAHNFKELGKSNITCVSGDSNTILENSSQKFDWIYIDPSRRSDVKGKVFMLNDCEPNVPENLNKYFTFSNNILIKTAPILDIQAGLLELKFVKNIYIIALENEVKELLWQLEKDYTSEITLTSVNLVKEETIVFTSTLGRNYEAIFGMPNKYLYEPNAAILKSGNFNAVSQNYNINKLHQHSHLYTSEELIDFAGRRFEIVKEIPYQKKELKENIIGQKMNVTTRNFPMKVEELRSKYKIKDGGTVFTFFTTNIENQKIVLICTKI